MKRYLNNFIYFLAGSAILCTFSTMQKIVAGYPIFFKGYFVPFFGGGIATFLIAKWVLILKEKKFKISEAEKSYNYLFESAPDGIDVLDKNGNILDCNGLELSLTGYTKEELIGKHFTEIMSEKSVKLFNQRFSALKSLHKYEGRIGLLCKNGKNIDIWRKAVPLVDSAGNFKGVLGFNRDITDLKNIEKKQRRLAIAVEQAGETIVITDDEANIQYANPAFEQTTGYLREDAMGRNPRMLQSSKHDKKFYRNMWNILTNGKTWKGHFINKKKDGKIYHEEATISPVIDDNGKIVNYIAVKRDITNELELKAQLAHNQRIEIIGTLAGGIAHDFNNILSPILGYSEMAIMDVPENSKLSKNLHAILAAATRASDLVKQILTFSRQKILELRPLEIQPVIKEALRLLRASLPTTIEIIQRIDNDCGLIMADASQLHQVIMNLCTNAFHAMEDTGGRIELDLNRVELTSDDLNGMHIEPGLYICLGVADNGRGMEKEIINKIFDPYFTTKDKGKGTGLGLSMVHGIIKNYGGDVAVCSEPGKGTEFRVYLPVIKDEFASLSKTAANDILQGDNERILVIDDKPEVLEIERQMLDCLGYQVTARTSSVEAVELFRAKPDEFDLVITDMTMPNMTGDKLAAEITKIRSDIPVILCTGFSERISQKHEHSSEISAVIMKPVTLEKLSKTIRKALSKT